MHPIVYFTDWVKAGTIAFGLTTTYVFQPFEDFSRDARILQDITLEQKVVIFEDDLLKNHLTSEDIFVYERPINTGDMCIWNGVHVGYRAIRYGYTHDLEDLVKLKRFMFTLEKLQTHPITGETILLRGRVKRADWNRNMPLGYRNFYYNDEWVWQEDASGDQFCGQVFGLAMAWKYGDQEVKDFVGILARDLYLYTKTNGFHLKNSDGTQTKFSCQGPSVTSSPMSITSYLVLTKLLALQYPNDLEVRDEYYTWAIKWNQIHVAAHNVAVFLWKMKYSGINQAHLMITAITELETNPKYLKHYVYGLRRGWKLLKDHGFSNWTYLMYKNCPKKITVKDLAIAKKTLDEFSTDKKVATNIDLTTDTTIRHTKWDGPKGVQPYPVWQRPAGDYIWQRNPYELIGGDAGNEYSGLDFLIAYYMGKLYVAL